MALWLVRAGRYGENEKKFLEENRVYLTWNDLSHNLGKITERDELRSLFEQVYPDSAAGLIRNNTSQIWAFAKRMNIGDWVVLPSKHKSAIHIAEIKSDYTFVPDAEDPYHHFRDIEWITQDIPRTSFDQDLLYSFGAFMTVCQIKRNDAEARVKAMAKTDWKSTINDIVSSSEADAENGEGTSIDLAQLAQDQIAKLIIARFKGHGLARLVDAVLRAQGYATHISPEGPDGGIDILAAPAPMGFSEPRICVQVKSEDKPLSRETLDNLIGVMQKVQATNGLLVSWSGFKSSIDKEVASQFFRVRLWDQGDLIEQVLTHYDKLGEDIQTKLPLQRTWIVSQNS